MSMILPDERIVGVDIETTGLDEETDRIIEIGVVIADLDCNILDKTSVMVWGDAEQRAYRDLRDLAASGIESAQFVLKMHQDNGLWEEAIDKGVSVTAASRYIETWLRSHGVEGKQDPMFGSSVDFDRRFLRYRFNKIDDLFHYRVIDVSTIKEACRRHNPEAYQLVHDTAYLHPTKGHRVIADLEDSLAEYKGYLDNFLITTR